MDIYNIVFILVFIFCAGQCSYLFVLAVSSVRPHNTNHDLGREPVTCFAIMIPAHNEEDVIESTVKNLLLLNYPRNLYQIFLIADHCQDETAFFGRKAGALVYERDEGPRTGKGAALTWLFQQILHRYSFDVAVIFDADTQVDADFLSIMDLHFRRGSKVIQGRHIICNPERGWFPALIWAMFIVDNRYQNQGRANINLSAKHMGDSICIRTDILREIGWGQGLADDYELRHELLLRDIRIEYEPCAIGYGEAPLTCAQAKIQRARWIKGALNSSRQNSTRLFKEGLKRKNFAMLDGAIQANFASYSTLFIYCISGFFIPFLTNVFIENIFNGTIIQAFLILICFMFFYPYFGLLLEKAPYRAYLAILSGPFFVIWRTWLAVGVRLGMRQVSWVRTKHGCSGNKEVSLSKKI